MFVSQNHLEKVFQSRGKIFIMLTGGKMDSLKCFYSLFSLKIFSRNDLKPENFSQKFPVLISRSVSVVLNWR